MPYFVAHLSGSSKQDKEMERSCGQRHPSVEVVPALLYTEIFQIQNGEIHKIKSSE